MAGSKPSIAQAAGAGASGARPSAAFTNAGSPFAQTASFAKPGRFSNATCASTQLRNDGAGATSATASTSVLASGSSVVIRTKRMNLRPSASRGRSNAEMSKPVPPAEPS